MIKKKTKSTIKKIEKKKKEVKKRSTLVKKNKSIKKYGTKKRLPQFKKNKQNSIIQNFINLWKKEKTELSVIVLGTSFILFLVLFIS